MLIERCEATKGEKDKVVGDLAIANEKIKTLEEEKKSILAQPPKLEVLIYGQMSVEDAKKNKYYNEVVNCESTDLSLSSIYILITIEGRGLTDDDAKAIAVALKTNTTITELYLGWDGGSKHILMLIFIAAYNKIGDEGAIAIADALKVNKTLTLLELGIYNAFYNPYYYRRQQQDWR
jgi:hypothetical protein